MSKKLLFVCVVLLAVSVPTSAAGFWGILLRGTSNSGSLSWGSQGGNSNYVVGGTQQATVTGSGIVLQGEGAAGIQDSDSDSQSQGMVAGQGQVIYNSGQGTANGLQTGAAGQTQTNPSGTATQTQYVTGIQYGTVTGANSGSQGVVVQGSVVRVQQYQSY